MDDSRHALRPEAGPLPFELLNRSQFNAMKAIITALKEAAAQAGKSQQLNDRDGLVDPNRVSRLYFVSGQPGSGKSSLYLTLRAILSKKERSDDIRKTYENQLDHLSALDGMTLWLEPIDLEVAGDTGENLLAAVLVRIFAALDESSGIESKRCQDAMTELNELANDIGIAWDGNLQARAPSLDPQSYSQEVMSAQRARLGTNKRLRRALDTLLKKKCYACNGETVFVLPIDDFYLKPAASLELLRLLRMISVPSLFFLIMGDIKTMEALFFEKALADWTAVAGPQVFASLKNRREEEVLPRVREMRARYLRKLLPAGQQATIEWTSWDEALKYTPNIAETSDDALSCLLSAIPIKMKIDPETESTNLLNYLVSPKYSQPPASADDNGSADVNGRVFDSQETPNTADDRVNVFREAYSALQILDATPREVVDLWMCLRELTQRKPTGSEPVPPYLWTVVDFALLAIEEQDFLTEKQQDAIRFAFPTSHKDDLLFETGTFSVEQKVSRSRKISDNKSCVREHLDWKIGTSKVKLGGNGPEQKFLPPRNAAWIILLHDLAWYWRRDSLTQNLVHGLIDKIKNKSRVSVTPKQDRPTAEHPGWAWYRHEEKWVHFPFPNTDLSLQMGKFDTFRQLDRFLKVWSYKLPSSDSSSLTLDCLVRRWVFAAWIAEGPEDRYASFVNEELNMPETKEDEKKIENGKLSEYRSKLLKADRNLEDLIT